MTTLMKINGACHCGAVTFTAEVDPARVAVCHCSDCQVLSGAPLRAIVAADIAGFALQGRTQRYVKQAQSGKRRAQVFCPECGTPLYGAAAENPTQVVIRVGCIEQRALLRPSRQIWLHSAQPWIGELAGVPGDAEQQ